MLSKRLPREKRTIRIYGERDDTDKYFRCWHCGTILDSKRETLDTGSYARPGVYVQDMPESATDVTLCNDDSTVTISLQGHKGVLQNGPDGNPISNYEHNQYPKISGGCWFCGCKNWK